MRAYNVATLIGPGKKGKHMKVILLITIALGAALCGCVIPEWTTGLPINYGTASTGGEGVVSNMLVSSDWLSQNAGRGRNDLIVVHVGKSRQLYDTRHIPGAQFVALDEISATRGDLPDQVPTVTQLSKIVSRLGVGKRDRIVVYDEEEGLMAARFYLAMDYIGLGGQTAMLDGQFKRWLLDKRPVTAEAPKSAHPDFAPQVRPEVLVSLETCRDLVLLRQDQPRCRTMVVDSRLAEEYAGKVAGEGIKRPGHIPGAVNVPWTSNLRSTANPVLLPPEELRKLYEQRGIVPEDKITTCCRTGSQAAMTYFVLKYLGYNVSLFGGSYWQWSRTADLPVQAEE